MQLVKQKPAKSPDSYTALSSSPHLISSHLTSLSPHFSLTSTRHSSALTALFSWCPSTARGRFPRFIPPF